MPVQATTSHQQWLVDRVLRPLEQDENKMKRLRFCLQKAIEDERPTASTFRSLVRNMVFKPANLDIYLSAPEVHFCSLWLWVNTLSMPASEFAVSSPQRTADALAELITFCYIPSETSMPEKADPTFVTQPAPAPAPAFETRHYVYGKDIAALSAVHLIEAIKAVEKEIIELDRIVVNSAFIDKRIEELSAMRAEIVKHLDKL